MSRAFIYTLAVIFAVILLLLLFFYPLSRFAGSLMAHSAMGRSIATYPDTLAAQTQADSGAYVSYDRIPECLRNAIISVEDKRFFKHAGIDPLAIVRVALETTRDDGEDHGGSTISQQLARAILKIPRAQSTLAGHVMSRLAVMQGSLILEHDFPKEKILELYLNTIYFGRGATGIGEAAQIYFGQPLAELDNTQCIYLAGLPQAPTTFGKDPGGAYTRERYEHVVSTMERNGYLASAEAAQVRADMPEVVSGAN